MTGDSAGEAGAARSRFPRGTVILVGLAAAAVASFGIAAIGSILAPVLLALVLTICAHPVRRALEKRGVPRGVATGSVIVVVFLLLAGFTATLVIAIAQFATMLPNYSEQLGELGTQVTDWLAGLGIGQDQIAQITSGFTPSAVLGFVTGFLGSAVNITASLVIVLTMLILMAADAGYVPTILKQLGRRQPESVLALTEFAHSVRRYMVVTTVLGLVQGVINGLALTLLGVPAALLWAILSFLCSFIPNVGYFVAIIPPLVFGYFVDGWPTVIAVVVIYGVINAVVQSIIQPRVVGNAVALSQTITFFSVLFWAVLIGPIGAILAIPLTLLVRAVLIDSDPAARWWRPVIGDLGETKVLMKQDDAVAKRERAERRHRDADAESDG